MSTVFFALVNCNYFDLIQVKSNKSRKDSNYACFNDNYGEKD
jgi:hypothetical protein